MDKLFEKLEAIQKQPVHVRQRILFVATGVLSTLVFLFWLSLFPSTLEKVDARRARHASGTSPFAALMGTVRGSVKELSGITDVIKDDIHYVKEKASTAPLFPSLPKEWQSTSTLSTTTLKEGQE